jgi:hypothetical protein
LMFSCVLLCWLVVGWLFTCFALASPFWIFRCAGDPYFVLGVLVVLLADYPCAGSGLHPLPPLQRHTLDARCTGAGEHRRVDQVSIENVATSETTVEDSCAVFIFIGTTPCTDFLGDRISNYYSATHVNWRPESTLGYLCLGKCRSGTDKVTASDQLLL